MSQKKCNPLCCKHLAQMEKNLWCAFSGNKLPGSPTGMQRKRRNSWFNMLFTSCFTLIPSKGSWAWSPIPTLHPSAKTEKKGCSYYFCPFPLYVRFWDEQFSSWGKKSKVGLTVTIPMIYAIWKKCHIFMSVPCICKHDYKSEDELLSVRV